MKFKTQVKYRLSLQISPGFLNYFSKLRNYYPCLQFAFGNPENVYLFNSNKRNTRNTFSSVSIDNFRIGFLQKKWKIIKWELVVSGY